MIESKTLERLGFTPEEASLYLALLDGGPATVAELARRSDLHRPAVYRALPRLEKRGFVTVIVRGKRRLYSAESPERLRSLLEDLTGSFDALLPELLQSYGAPRGRPVVKMLTGKRAITWVLRDIVTVLKPGATYYRYSARNSERDTRYLPREYHTLRDRKNLQRMVITSEARMANRTKRLNRAMKGVPRKLAVFEFDTTLFIYADKLAYVDFNTESVIVVESRVLAAFHTQLFQILYALL